MKYLLALLLVLLMHGAFSWHIVGGELEFITIEPGRYRINLIKYRDEAQTMNPGPVNFYDVVLFSNKTNQEVLRRTVALVSNTRVQYTVPKCAIDELKTNKVLYTAEFSLNPQDFADEEGYYWVWERCCRNEGIANFVVVPGENNGTGMKYVLEIPPLWKNGAPYLNTTPILLPPLSDYACINQLYYTNFAGVDPDGDSLVYRLATPLNSSSSDALPTPQSKPHIEMVYRDGFSLNNMVPGSQPLRISNRGLLTVNPSDSGLYIFSVIVEEWRAGVKHGEVQRDFQMLVISNGCNPPDPPVVGVKIPDNPTFNSTLDTLRFTVAEDKCFDFLVTNITEGETISLRAEGVNFTGDIREIFSFESQFIGPGQDTLLVEVCMGACPPVRGGPFIVDLIAGDDACPLPQLDTARLMIEVEPPPNVFPVLDAVTQTYVLNEGEQVSIPLRGTDDDLDMIDLSVRIPGVVDAEAVGFSIEITKNEAGETEAVLNWNTDCLLYDFTERQQFLVGISLEDQDVCELENDNTTWLDMRVILPINTSPEIDSEVADSVAVFLDERLQFDAAVTDADGDTVNLWMTPVGFGASFLGVSFPQTRGAGSTSSTFDWQPTCEVLRAAGTTDFVFHFLADDEDRCQEKNFDTLSIKVHVEVPENFAPYFRQQADTAIRIGQTVQMPITAFDDNPDDEITIELFAGVRLPNSPSLSFQRAVGTGSVTSVLEWTPECDLLDLGQTSAFFNVAFLVYDNSCLDQKLDTMLVTFEVFEDREAFNAFTPPNVFTPNGDGVNDTYSLTNMMLPIYNLPRDNCDDRFQSIVVFDRTGKNVFESTSREFVWHGENVPAGVYYYLIRYTATEYKGFIQVLK